MNLFHCAPLSSQHCSDCEVVMKGVSARLLLLDEKLWPIRIKYEFMLLSQNSAKGCSGLIFFFQQILVHVTFFFTASCLVISASVSARVDPVLCLFPQQECLHGNDQFRSNLYCWLFHQCIDPGPITVEPLSKHQLSFINLEINGIKCEGL